MNRSLAFMSFLAFALLGGVALAQMKYQGEVVSVDEKAHTFTVRATAKGESPEEMKFHADKDSQVYVDGERKLFAELIKGDHVTVSYGTSGQTHMAKKVERHSGTAEKTFSGEVIEVDPKAETFTVRAMVAGKAEERKFHASHESRFYVGAEQLTLVSQLQKGDWVDVHYETVGGEHHVKHVSKGKNKPTT